MNRPLAKQLQLLSVPVDSTERIKLIVELELALRRLQAGHEATYESRADLVLAYLGRVPIASTMTIALVLGHYACKDVYPLLVKMSKKNLIAHLPDSCWQLPTPI